MGKKRKADEPAMGKVKISPKKTKKQKVKKERRSDSEDSDDEHHVKAGAGEHGTGEHLMEREQMPSDDVLYKLIDKIEAELPKDDVVKFDSR